jgi:hypothetical protein
LVYESQGWAIETAGWAIDEGDESAAFTPADAPDDAALVVSSFRSDHGPIRDEELSEMAGKGSPAAVERTEVRCGAFSGYRACYDEDETHWRVWWLAHGGRDTPVRHVQLRAHGCRPP